MTDTCFTVGKNRDPRESEQNGLARLRRIMERKLSGAFTLAKFSTEFVLRCSMPNLLGS